MDPVPQRLTIHAANAGGLLAIHPVVNRRYGKQSPRLVRVLHRSRHAAKLLRLKIFPNPDRRAHPVPPNQIYSGRNESHRSGDGQESAIPKAGIRHSGYSEIQIIDCYGDGRGVGKRIRQASAAIAAPTSCAATKPGTWLSAIPANVVVSPRASVTAGLANDVEEVNQ
jgi:hypothetical protein